VGGSERLVISCPFREERQRLVELLQKLIRSPIMSSPSANSTVLPYVSCRPPFWHLARYLARLIKTGRLTRRILRDILDGGEAERHRRLILGYAFLDHSNQIANPNHFRRRCHVECHLSIGPKQKLDTCPSPQSRSIYVEKKLTLGVPFLSSSQFDDTTTPTSSTCSSSLTSVRERVVRHWSSLSWAHMGGRTGGSIGLPSPISESSHTLSRTQSLPLINLRCDRYDNSRKSATSSGAEVEVADALGHSTTVGAWISHFSFDSGLADVGTVTRSPSGNALSNTSPLELDLRASSPVYSVYRSTLYAHWWRKAKFPIQSSGKGMESSFS